MEGQRLPAARDEHVGEFGEDADGTMDGQVVLIPLFLHGIQGAQEDVVGVDLFDHWLTRSTIMHTAARLPTVQTSRPRARIQTQPQPMPLAIVSTRKSSSDLLIGLSKVDPVPDPVQGTPVGLG